MLFGLLISILASLFSSSILGPAPRARGPPGGPAGRLPPRPLPLLRRRPPPAQGAHTHPPLAPPTHTAPGTHTQFRQRYQPIHPGTIAVCPSAEELQISAAVLLPPQWYLSTVRSVCGPPPPTPRPWRRGRAGTTGGWPRRCGRTSPGAPDCTHTSA